MRKNFLAPIIFLIAIAITAGYIYVNSAKFIETPTIVMPGDVTSEIEYTNRNMLSEVEINTDNFKEVISSLSRPESYSMTVSNTLYAYDKQMSFLTYINVSGSNILAQKDDLKYLILNNQLSVEQGGEIKQVNMLDLTRDNIIGIPTYEDVIELESVEKASLHTINNEQVIVITAQENDLTNRYYISLATGMLTSYEVISGDKVLRLVMVKDLKIGEQDLEIFKLT